MGFMFEQRESDSPYIETIMKGYTVGEGSAIRPAECHWHMVISKRNGRHYPIFTGPLTSSGMVDFAPGVELLWIQFKLGTFMPHLPARKFLNVETNLPTATTQSFWLKSSAWQFPTYENVETFVNRLVRDDVLMHDPVVEAALNDQPQNIPPRTLRHRFLRATGLTQSHIHQMRRAQQAQALLEQGVSILDTVFAAGYFDQPHLTRSLKQFTGYTPAQIVRACHSVQDPDFSLSYDKGVLVR